MRETRGWQGASAFRGSHGVAGAAAARPQVPSARGQRGKQLSETASGHRSFQINPGKAYWGVSELGYLALIRGAHGKVLPK